MSQEISYTHKQSPRARRMRVAVHCDGSVVVTSPLGVPPSMVARLINDQKQWVLNKIQFFKNADRKILRPFSRQDYLANKDRALVLISARVKFYNEMYGFSYHRLTIKHQKTRWGSCSRHRNLNLNYQLLFLPDELRDYIVVHELCHLKQFNHSSKFWSLVAQTLPHYLALRKELRRYQLSR